MIVESFESLDAQVPDVCTKMDDYLSSLEALDNIIEMLTVSGGVCRSQIESLESIGHTWDNEYFPSVTFTESVTEHNYGIAMEGLISKAMTGVTKLISGTFGLFVAIVAGLISVIVKLFGGKGDSSKSTPTPSKVKAATSAISKGEKVGTDSKLVETANKISATDCPLLDAIMHIDLSDDMLNMSKYVMDADTSLELAGRVLLNKRLGKKAYTAAEHNKIIASFLTDFNEWGNIVNALLHPPYLVEKVAHGIGFKIESEFAWTTGSVKTPHRITSNMTKLQQKVDEMAKAKSSPEGQKLWLSRLRGQGLDKLKALYTDTTNIDEVTESLETLKNTVDDMFADSKKQGEAILQLEKELQDNREASKNMQGHDSFKAHRELMRIVESRAMELRQAVTLSLLPCVRIAITTNAVIARQTKAFTAAVEGLDNRKAS